MDTIRNVPVLFEPRRNNRFTVEFPTELGIESWKVQSFSRPKGNINNVKIAYFNGFDYVTGHFEWQPVTIKLIDTMGPSTSTQIMNWVRLHYESLTNRAGYASGYKKDIILKSTDPTGVDVEKWIIEQCQIIDFDMGEHDYNDDEVTIITLTVQPKRCIQKR